MITNKRKNELIDKVLEPIHEAGFTVAFVGGCVRDFMMGAVPHDFDIATNAKPSDLHKIFHKFSNVSDNSENYGVTMPLIEFDDVTVEEVEIATFRKDVTKGRHPKIVYTDSVEEDAFRRDFTVNALYEDIYGNIIDPTGQGKKDIKDNILRFVGNPQDRITEDPLRIFRFVRFLASKGFISAYKTNEVTKWNADFDGVSKERVLKELEKTFGGRHLFDEDFTKGNRPSPFDFFLAAGIQNKMPRMKEFITKMMHTEQSWSWHSEGSLWKDENGKLHFGESISFHNFEKMTPVVHGTVWDHTLRVMWLMQEKMYNLDDEHKRFVMMMAAFLHDVGKCYSHLGMKHNVVKMLDGRTFEEDVPKVTDHDIVGAPFAECFCKEIGMTNVDAKLIYHLTKYHMRVHRLSEMKSKCAIWSLVSKPFFGDLVVLAKCDEGSCIKVTEDEWSGIATSLKLPNISELIDKPMPARIITGDDLVKAGLKPDETFKKRLEVAYTFQIDKDCNDKDRLLKTALGVTMPKKK